MLHQQTKQNPTAFITGGGGGIGKEISRELFSRGMNVGIGDIDFESAEKTVRELDPEGSRTLAISLDVSKGQEALRAAGNILARFGRVDVLVNNAGISPWKENRRISIAEIDEEEWDQVMAVNLKGVFNCSRAVMDNMIQNRYGKIVNIASTAGITGGGGGPAGAHYGASKAGIIALTKTLAWELGPFGINVNVIAPGLITGTGLSLPLATEDLEKRREALPIRRLGKMGDISKLVAFLVSDDAGYIHGETIVVDGGMLMR
jgi:3-oxoacyl-[acyl-carrier protein] reductase